MLAALVSRLIFLSLGDEEVCDKKMHQVDFRLRLCPGTRWGSVCCNIIPL